MMIVGAPLNGPGATYKILFANIGVWYKHALVNDGGYSSK